MERTAWQGRPRGHHKRLTVSCLRLSAQALPQEPRYRYLSQHLHRLGPRPLEELLPGAGRSAWLCCQLARKSRAVHSAWRLRSEGCRRARLAANAVYKVRR
jgi:hypothetical protein